jgi:hypothetical protein
MGMMSNENRQQTAALGGHVTHVSNSVIFCCRIPNPTVLA